MEPKDFGRVIWRRKRTVATAIIVAVAAVFFASSRKAPLFVSSCNVLYQATEYDVTNPDFSGVETVGTPQSNLNLFRSGEIQIPAAAALGIDHADIKAIANVELIPETQIFTVTVADPGAPHPDEVSNPPAENPRYKWKDNPGQRAADICNTYAQQYVKFKRDQAAEVFETQLTSKEAALASARNQYQDLQEAYENARTENEALDLLIRRNSVLDRLGGIQGEITGLKEQLANGISGGGRLIDPAGPGVMTKADMKKDATMGLILGLLFGVGVAMLREYLDDTVKDKESTQRELGLPVLAALPSTDDIDGLEEPSTGTIEAARKLRATLASLGFPQEKRTLLITSSLAKRRPTTLASLAAAVAESGRSVLVIGSDLRSGRTHEAFGIANTVGLANVVRGQVPFEKAIRPAPGMEGVYVLPCGPIIGNPGELLSSEAMAMTLRRARRWADVVLLDAPPVLAAADSSILGAYADGVVLVVSAGQTNRNQANEAKEQLIAAGARVLGAVLIGSDEGTQHEEYGDDLGSFGGWDGGGFDAGAYDAYQSYDDGWYADEPVTMTAYAEPRAPRRRTSPPKKTAASRAGQRPTPKREASLPRAGVRTTQGSRSTGRATSATRATNASKAKTASRARATAATRNGTRTRTTTAKRPTPRR